MLIEGGKSVLVSGCTFDETSVGIDIAPTANNFSITGNTFPQMAHPARFNAKFGFAPASTDRRKLLASIFWVDLCFLLTILLVV